jgi:RNA polymerase sigma-70 factor (ECF subfamily)
MSDEDNIKSFFSNQVEEQMHALYGVALRLTGKGADAEDLVADAVVKAWSAIHTLQDRARFRPWIFRILHNCHISNYRKKSVRPEESPLCEDDEHALAVLLNEQPDEFLIWWANPERQFFNNLLGDTILAAMDELPKEYQMAILLINVEGLTYDEAAEALGVPQGTIRSRMKRARTMLQKSLWEYARDAGITGGEANE